MAKLSVNKLVLFPNFSKSSQLIFPRHDSSEISNLVFRVSVACRILDFGASCGARLQHLQPLASFWLPVAVQQHLHFSAECFTGL